MRRHGLGLPGGLRPGPLRLRLGQPPCTEHSKAKTVGTRKLEESNAVAQRTLDIIRYLSPFAWALENPQTGLLKCQPLMENIPYQDVGYCKYGMPYRKRTRIWTNFLSTPIRSAGTTARRPLREAPEAPSATPTDGTSSRGRPGSWWSRCWTVTGRTEKPTTLYRI